VSIAESNGHINFGKTFSKPLPTLNEAYYNEDEKSITVNAVFLVETKLETLHPKVNQLFTIGDYGEYQLQFFIYYDEEELTKIINNPPKEDNKYKSYKLQFTTTDTTGFPTGPKVIIDPKKYKTDDIKMKDITVVQTFLWDIDPETSRGTRTTVKSAI
jgi:hypothetical protein